MTSHRAFELTLCVISLFVLPKFFRTLLRDSLAAIDAEYESGVAQAEAEYREALARIDDERERNGLPREHDGEYVDE